MREDTFDAAEKRSDCLSKIACGLQSAGLRELDNYIVKLRRRSRVIETITTPPADITNAHTQSLMYGESSCGDVDEQFAS